MISAEEYEQAEANPEPKPRARFGRNRLEPIAMAIMGLGALMMFQPYLLGLYTYSFVVILAGTLMFVVVSHFPD